MTERAGAAAMVVVAATVVAAMVVACGDAGRAVAPAAPVETVAIPIPAAPPASVSSFVSIAPPGPSDSPSAPGHDTGAPDRTYTDETLPPLDANANANANGGCAPFDRGAAARALAAVNVLACKTPGGPTGAGHLKIAFDPTSGRVRSITLDAGPFPGTREGACVLGQFRGATVPPFCGGAAVTIGKSFSVP